MVIAFQNFKEIEKLKTTEEKHRAWLKDYEGLHFSIGKNKKDLIYWKKDMNKYIYNDHLWSGWMCCDFKGGFLYAKDINKIQRHKNRLVIEFDGEKTNEFLEEVYNKLKEKKIGFIRSNHGGKCDYLWVEFTRELKPKEAKEFLKWVAPEGSEVDINFCSDARRLPVLFAKHWKYDSWEMPTEYFEGEQIDYDSLNIQKPKGEIKKAEKEEGLYYTFKKAASLFTTKGQVETFNKIQPLFYDKSGLWWLWNLENKAWELVDEIDILNMIKDTTGEDTVSSKNRTEILNALKQEGRKNIPKPIQPTWIQFKDEVVDILTGKRFSSTPKYFATNPIPWKLNDDNFEQTPTMDKIFEEWVGKKYIKTLYEIIAYCLLPDYPIHRLFCFIGAGLNGKSKFLELLRNFIGGENVTSTELDTLINSRFEVTRLHKKLVCQLGETDFNEMSKTSIIKKLTGGDLIGFEYKNKTPFEEHNYAKILISTNNLPTTTDKTLGFYRRWLIIDFPNTFSEKIDILETIPKEEYECLALKSLSILKDLLKNRRFHNEGSVEDRMEKYEAKSDFLQKFLDEFTKESIGNFISKAEFHKKFKGWCNENRHREIAENTLGKKMKEKNIETGQKYAEWLYDGKGGQMRVWLDLQWN